MLGIITPKVQENITVVGKVTLHVWTSNWGQRPAAKALNRFKPVQLGAFWSLKISILNRNI